MGYPDPIGDAQGPYDIACSLFTVVLAFASRRLGWPPEDEVYRASMGRAPTGAIDVERAMHEADEPID